jgi:hypothetical protein
MTQARGINSQVVIDFESTYGTSPATVNGILVPFNNCALQAKQTLTDAPTIRGNRNPIAPILGKIDVSGDITVPVDEMAFGYWLKAFCGAPTTTGTGEPYTHVFKPGITQPSLVIDKEFTDIGQYLLYNGCKVNQIKMTLGGDNELTAALSIIGGTETSGTTAYDATPSSLTFARFYNFQGSVKEGGSSIAYISQLELTISGNLNGDQYCIGSQGFRSDIPEGLLGVSGTVTALFKDAALLDKAINGTESSLELALTSGTHSLTIAIPELIYERETPGISGPQGINIQLPFRGYYDNNTDSTSIMFTLVNDVSSYA